MNALAELRILLKKNLKQMFLKRAMSRVISSVYRKSPNKGLEFYNFLCIWIVSRYRISVFKVRALFIILSLIFQMFFFATRQFAI